jgi:hypothetical protein
VGKQKKSCDSRLFPSFGTKMTLSTSTGTFVPSQEDFDSHPLKYPKRLLLPNDVPLAEPVPRRIRPIPIQPPPGFESTNPNAKTNTAASPTKSSGYIQFAKMRAIAGCLDGDWSSKYTFHVILLTL